MSVDFTGVTLPFTVADLLTTTMDFIQLFGPFVLLGMAIYFAPQIVDFFKGVMSRRGKKA